MIELPLQLAEIVGRKIEELLPDDDTWFAQWTCGYGVNQGDEQTISIIKHRGTSVRKRHGRTRRHKHVCYGCIIKIKHGIFTVLFPENPYGDGLDGVLTLDPKTADKWTYELADPNTNLDEILPTIIRRVIGA